MGNKTLGSVLSFRIIQLIHDNPLRPFFDNPDKTLTEAGIQRGHQVLEVGCGPGYFTIPAAKMVGETGCIYAIDIVPRAIETVVRKLRKSGLKNVKATVADVSVTGLESSSIDIVLLFGVIHRLSLNQVLPEMHRVLKPEGVIAVKGGSSRYRERMLKGGFFSFAETRNRLSKFTKNRSVEDMSL
jgi:ubiquinone/menaquinone biosynthesis C-methylase UbiE